ncbi:unnamed protein product [Closterium sp. NIES-64]|nr:unnamed protein product [Closterium sp. NIES-64]
MRIKLLSPPCRPSRPATSRAAPLLSCTACNPLRGRSWVLGASGAGHRGPEGEGPPATWAAVVGLVSILGLPLAADQTTTLIPPSALPTACTSCACGIDLISSSAVAGRSREQGAAESRAGSELKWAGLMAVTGWRWGAGGAENLAATQPSPHPATNLLTASAAGGAWQGGGQGGGQAGSAQGVGRARRGR